MDPLKRRTKKREDMETKPKDQNALGERNECFPERKGYYKGQEIWGK